MKKGAIISIILLIMIILTCILLQKGLQKTNNLSEITDCNIDDDCTLKFNILNTSNGQCSVGCFNNQAKKDSNCNLMWEDIPNPICKCINNTCKLYKP